MLARSAVAGFSRPALVCLSISADDSIGDSTGEPAFAEAHLSHPTENAGLLGFDKCGAHHSRILFRTPSSQVTLSGRGEFLAMSDRQRRRKEKNDKRQQPEAVQKRRAFSEDIRERRPLTDLIA